MATITAIQPGGTLSSIDKRDVATDLVYWKPIEGHQKTIDFTSPEGRAEYAEIDRLDEHHQVKINDVRGEETAFTLEKNGFQYVNDPVPELDDWSDQEKIKEILIPRTEELVRQITGASKVVTFTHRIRCFAKDENQLADNRSPAHSVHSDFTVAGALKQLSNVVKDPTELEELSKGRIIAINVWRPLKTVRRDPLAVCDWTSIDPNNDRIAERMLFPHGWNELGKYAHSNSHKWYYLSNQRPDEPLLFKQFDNKKIDQGGFTLAHTAFVDPESTEVNPRESIEIKMFAFVAEN